MNRILLALFALGLLAGSSRAVLQVDVDATLFPAGHDPDSGVMVLFGNPTQWPATLVAGPDGFPLAYHLIFNYDGQIAGGAVATVSMTAGACTKTWTPTAFSTFYQAGPAFPVFWAANGTVAPDNNPFALCTCWPDDPDCNPPACSVSVASLDFGTTPPNVPVTRTLTISNTGGGTLAGTVGEDCAEYSVQSGASYSLGAGQVQTVTVQLLSATPGPYSCSLNTGASCPAVSMTGTVSQPAACSVDPASLDFGTTLPGIAVTRTFAITNTGGGTLSGEVTESCEPYQIISGASYSLGANESQTVTVQFQTATMGSHPCSLDVGGGCGALACTGVIDGPPACSIDPPVLNFGTLAPGVIAELDFVVTNSGGGVLAGEFGESCPEFSIIEGAIYSLGPGLSQAVTVRFQSAGTGNFACPVIGSSCPNSVLPCLATVAEPAPVCAINPPSLDFGTNLPDSPVMLDFTITNTGGGTLAGTVALGCGNFALTSPAGYSLAAGASQTFTVDFLSSEPGEYSCTLDTGSPCTGLPLSGTVELAPLCQISADSLDFGSLIPNTPATLSFTVTNAGGHTLSGTVSETCPAFSISSGGTYSLGAGQSQTVSVLFQSDTPGDFSCTVDTGGDCADVACAAVVELAPDCAVSPTILDFGTVLPDTPVEAQFTITNNGGGLLSGMLAEECAAFTIVGDPSYSLATGESRAVTIRFQSVVADDYTCTVDTGGACADVTCSGSVEPAPACVVDPPSLDFGTTTPDLPVTRTFTITNTGGGTLAGMVVEDCPAYSIISAANYSLTAGESQSFTVQLQTVTQGNHVCTLGTGGDCASLPCTGVVEAAPSCLVPASLDLGVVLPGTPATGVFSITNDGGGILSGSVVDECESFSVVAGGTYSLGAGQSQEVTVRFLSNTPGDFMCNLDPGSSCPPVQLSGAAMSIQVLTGAESACGPVDNLGHLPGSTTGFAPEWAAGEIGLQFSNAGGLTVAVSIWVNGQQAWSGPVNSGTWLASSAAGFDLADWFDENIQLHFEVSDGTSSWNAGGAECSWDLSFLTTAELARPTAFRLHEPMPNPFNPITRLQLDLPEPDHVRLAVMDLRGRQVELLADSDLPAGRHQFVWQPRQMASGTYFITLECRQGTQVRKALFLK